ncbi:hypothetical protein CY652_15765 [Burkholderia sp. WAC0059]|uniref:helix-turn-helix domain-containing protein n=1 Tax=Burkholderia sp. WAC0059 TaxID=2066022 RepID=UPI000C7F6AE6|nr:hypothetical protein CY652_15765 [Burkholderia sp. WAC0059]
MSDGKMKELEVCRRKGMQMLKRGLSQAEVVRVLGVSRQTASRWAKMLAEDPLAWRARKRGRPVRLSDRQLRRLDRLVRGRVPQEHGFAQYRWSVALIRDLIEKEFGVRYESVSNVRRILRELGLFPRYGWTRGMMSQAQRRWVRDGRPVPW